MIIPRKVGEKDICLEFLQDMSTYVLRDDVVIYGGNDNSDRSLPPSNVTWHHPIPKDTVSTHWVGRKDGDWWVLFNTKDGLKSTLSFKDEPEEYKVASIPELVDLKITEICTYGCKYCYMGSTHNGQHGEGLESWVSHLAYAGVFEVAIGGGEPTMHPEFTRLLESRAHSTRGTAFGDLVINFTTRNYEWLLIHADLVMKSCGAFAVSIDSVEDIDKLLHVFARTLLRDKCTIQYVMGVSDDFVFERIVERCGDEGLALTLLGYKMTGRGATAKKKRLIQNKKQESLQWVDHVKQSKGSIAIDTTLAAKVPTGVFPEYMLRRTEGTHSMYIDMVTGQAGISSYQPELLLPVDKSNIVKVFKQLQEKLKAD
jgi:organic radical activating enzyme